MEEEDDIAEAGAEAEEEAGLEAEARGTRLRAVSSCSEGP